MPSSRKVVVVSQHYPPDHSTTAAIMSAIAEAFGFGTWLSTTEIVERSTSEKPDEAGKQLYAALSAALPHGVSPQGVARYLTKLSGRRVEGMLIKVMPNPKKGGRYAIMSENAGEPKVPTGSQLNEFAFEDAAAWEPIEAYCDLDDVPY